MLGSVAVVSALLAVGTIELLEDSQSVLRALLYALLLAVAGYRWARPLMPGMTAADCAALVKRARVWVAIGGLGIASHLTAALEVSAALRNVPQTVLVVLIVFKGLDSLGTRRRVP